VVALQKAEIGFSQSDHLPELLACICSCQQVFHITSNVWEVEIIIYNK